VRQKYKSGLLQDHQFRNPLDFTGHAGTKLKRVQVMCQYNGEQIRDQAIKVLHSFILSKFKEF
jgi:hypothetical protein